jgi:hypothetical protein
LKHLPAVGMSTAASRARISSGVSPLIAIESVQWGVCE